MVGHDRLSGGTGLKRPVARGGQRHSHGADVTYVQCALKEGKEETSKCTGPVRTVFCIYLFRYFQTNSIMK
jgi:hypothetical protein